MAAYKPPHYVTIGLFIMGKTPDGKIVGMPMGVEEVGEAGIGALIEGTVNNLIAAGLTPLTQEEYNDFARELAAREQVRKLTEAMSEQAKYGAIDPARMAAILAAHKGRPGGDA